MNLAFNGNKPFDVETRHALSLPKKLDSRVIALDTVSRRRGSSVIFVNSAYSFLTMSALNYELSL